MYLFFLRNIGETDLQNPSAFHATHRWSLVYKYWYVRLIVLERNL